MKPEKIDKNQPTLEDIEEYNDMMGEIDNWQHGTCPVLIPKQEHKTYPIFKTDKEQDEYLVAFMNKAKKARIEPFYDKITKLIESSCIYREQNKKRWKRQSKNSPKLNVKEFRSNP